jgi:coniferyl-aldehyde dehydrogenase
MQAASDNLTPVTLELGGKSPAIVHEDYPIDTAVGRILTGKLYNAGQTCVAPDYALVPSSKRMEFIEKSKAAIGRMYPKLVDNREYTRIINAHHYRRLASLMDNARIGGAEIHEVNPSQEMCSESNRVMPPALLTNLHDDLEIMHEEIFGPLLPVLTYDSLDEAMDYVNARPRPLALYYFDHNRTRVDRVLESTVSGGVTVNDCLVHLGVPDLPFGGVGASGMGHYHGFDGFVTFSKKKGVFLQGRWSALGLFRPPYSNAARRVLSLLTR